MRALLLAAGLGTRLKPYTDSIPKCLMPFNGKPLLEIWINKILDAGVTKILINGHHHYEQLAEFINRSKYKKYISLVYEEVLLGTAGTLVKNQAFFKDEDGLILHADNFWTGDLTKFVTQDLVADGNCLISMLTFIADNPKQCGIVKKNNNNIVTGFDEKPEYPESRLANGAIYIFKNKAIRSLSESDEMFDISRDLIPKFLGKICAYESDGVLIDIGTEESYMRALQEHRDTN